MKKNYKTFIRNFIYLLLCILVTWQAWEVSRENRNGAVSSTSKIASDVGIDVLKKGGNAFDAIVATGFALAVTSPANGNIGGGGFLVAHTASGESVSLDFREKAPKLSYESMFLNENGEYDEGEPFTDWNGNGVIDESAVSSNINCRASGCNTRNRYSCSDSAPSNICGDSACTALADNDDWAQLSFTGILGLTVSDGVLCDPLHTTSDQ